MVDLVVAMVPDADVEIPGPVLALAGDAPVTPLWVNELDGLTVRIDRPEPLVVKWSAPPAPALEAEAQRLRWLGSRHPAPEVVACDRVGDAWMLVTTAIDGESAVTDRWRAHPLVAVAAIAEGLRRLHALDPADCPFDWQPQTRIESARAAGVPVAPELECAPDVDQLVVAHGDACAPNTLLGADGTFRATVDVGTLGISDRWADLAVASMSLEWNYGPGFADAFWQAYGCTPDAERIAYYRALWNAT